MGNLYIYHPSWLDFLSVNSYPKIIIGENANMTGTSKKELPQKTLHSSKHNPGGQSPDVNRQLKSEEKKSIDKNKKSETIGVVTAPYQNSDGGDVNQSSRAPDIDQRGYGNENIEKPQAQQ